MTTWRVGPEVALAQLEATIARADAGSGRCRVRLHTTPRPGSVVDAAGGTAQAEIILSKPCASIVGGALVWHAEDAGGALVMLAGIPRWGVWIGASGIVVAEGSVTDAVHGGDFRVAGGTTPDGEDSPLLLAGGLVVLAPSALT
ncbi:hypothetical protein SAMN04489709_101191 [Paracidovorax citrulli]|uniref:hypothetical protein n=1 Tax=Paracidovorax citrulli TaxID=80869 RepID=UPI000890CE9B|nr:hypothetical protein [Paracidovorax citrulli]UMT89750.1 hypothetical protein FRC90_17880 [Paracidovorax citrulli]SDJ08562.1 hypothetical protein SAMN04489709_101191 [Paracidovorax citrulli]